VRITDVPGTRVARAITLVTSFMIGLAVLVMAAPGAPQGPASSGSPSQTEKITGAQLKVRQAELPLSFEPNLGQTERQVKLEK